MSRASKIATAHHRSPPLRLWLITTKPSRSADAAPKCCPSGPHFPLLVRQCSSCLNLRRKIMHRRSNSTTSATRKKGQDEYIRKKTPGIDDGLLALRHGRRESRI